MAPLLHLACPERLGVTAPPYIDPSERGGYDTDELDALEAAAAELPAPEEDE